MRRRELVGATAALLPFIPGISFADESADSWPGKPVRIIVPFAPGGSNDVMARKLAQRLNESFNQPFIVENRAGAGSVIGSNVVAHANGDGYTLLFISSTITTTPAIQKLPYNPMSDLTPICTIASSPFYVLTRNDFPAKTMKEFISYAKNNPRMINYGTAGYGDSAQLASELMSNLVDIKMQAIAYQGITPAQLDLVTGRIDMLITTIASIRGTPAENLPKIAITTKDRSGDFPRIPTVQETIGKDYNVDVWWGMFAGKNAPASVQTRLGQEIKKIIYTDEFKKFLETLGAAPDYRLPEEMKKTMEKEIAIWKKVAEQAGISK